MSDRDRDDGKGGEDEEDDEVRDRHLDTEETSGLGLTEEFRRIESEIEHATDEQPGQGEPAAAEPAPPAADGEPGGTEEWNAAGEGGDGEWVPEGEPPSAEQPAETGSWTDEHEAPHDTGEWIGATGEAEAQAAEQISGEHERVSEDFEVVSEEFEQVSGEHEAVSGEFEEVTGDHEEVSGEFEEITGDHEEVSGDFEEVSGEFEPVSEEQPAAPAGREDVVHRRPEPPAAAPEPDEPEEASAAEQPAAPVPVEPLTRVQRSKPAAEAARAAAAAAAAASAGAAADAGASAAANTAGTPGDQRPTEVRPPPTDPGSLTPIPPGPRVPPGGYGGGYGGGYEDLPDLKVPSLWLRFFSGSVLIIASVAASVAVAGLLFIGDIAAKINPIPRVDEQLEEVASDAPQTVLIIGSDYRSDEPEAGARSDTTMLLRVDPEKDVLSLFSLPRDLEVDIPGYATGRKLNEAYTVGGASKTLKTVKEFTDLPINHVVEINFEGFADAVNAIDCVYVDVDREYFNDNSTALSEADTYSAIDINAGYQRLCGEKALQYVRYRHTDSDIVRAARQQDFLREARQKVDPKELLPVFGDTGNELIDIFTEYTRSDIDSTSQVLGILRSFIGVRESPVNEVQFEGYLGDALNTNVTTTNKQLDAALDQFLNGVSPPVEEEEPSEPEDSGSDEEKKKDKPKSDEEKPKDEDPLADANVIPVDQLAVPDAFIKDAEKNARRLDFPIYSPTVVPPDAEFNTDSRTYEFENEENKEEDAYKIVITYDPTGVIEYFGVMGTTWDDPPILRDPTDEIEIDGREYLLFYDGDRLRMVGWKTDEGSYWLNNTLSQTIDETEMLAMATTMREVP